MIHFAAIGWDYIYVHETYGFFAYAIYMYSEYVVRNSKLLELAAKGAIAFVVSPVIAIMSERDVGMAPAVVSAFLSSSSFCVSSERMALFSSPMRKSMSARVAELF